MNVTVFPPTLAVNVYEYVLIFAEVVPVIQSVPPKVVIPVILSQEGGVGLKEKVVAVLQAGVWVIANQAVIGQTVSPTFIVIVEGGVGLKIID